MLGKYIVLEYLDAHFKLPSGNSVISTDRLVRLKAHLQKRLQRSALIKALVLARLKFTANKWAFLVNSALHGISVQRRAPAIIQPFHGHAAPLINFNKVSGYAGVANE